MQVAGMLAALVHMGTKGTTARAEAAAASRTVVTGVCTALLLPAAAFCLGLAASVCPPDAVLWGMLHGAVRVSCSSDGDNHNKHRQVTLPSVKMCVTTR